jgi:hypothetical protein
MGRQAEKKRRRRARARLQRTSPPVVKNEAARAVPRPATGSPMGNWPWFVLGVTPFALVVLAGVISDAREAPAYRALSAGAAVVTLVAAPARMMRVYRHVDPDRRPPIWRDWRVPAGNAGEPSSIGAWFVVMMAGVLVVGAFPPPVATPDEVLSDGVMQRLLSAAIGYGGLLLGVLCMIRPDPSNPRRAERLHLLRCVAGIAVVVGIAMLHAIADDLGINPPTEIGRRRSSPAIIAGLLVAGLQAAVGAAAVVVIRKLRRVGSGPSPS